MKNKMYRRLKKKGWFGCRTIVISLLFIFGVLITVVSAGEVKLSWTAPNTDSDSTPLADFAGFHVYYGTSSRNYTSSIDVGNLGTPVDPYEPFDSIYDSTYTLTGLADSMYYYFAVTAYDIAGNESDYSNEISRYISTSSPSPPPSAGAVATRNDSSGSNSVGGSSGCFIGTIYGRQEAH